MEFRNPFSKCEFYSKMPDSLKMAIGWTPDERGKVGIKIGELNGILLRSAKEYHNMGTDAILTTDKAIWETQRQALEIINKEGFVSLYTVEQIFKKEMEKRMNEN